MNTKDMLKKLLALFLLFSLSGCALHTSLVSFLRLDTHQINIKDSTGDFRAERAIMSQALEYCDAIDKHFIPVEIKKSFDQNTYSLTFRCLDPGDPELTQQNQLENSNEKDSTNSDFLSSSHSQLPLS